VNTSQMKKTLCHHKLCGGTGYEHEMYKNSPQQDIFGGLPLPENSGWKVEDSRYTIDGTCRRKLKEPLNFSPKGAHANVAVEP